MFYLDNFFKTAPHIEIKQLSCDSRVPMKDCIFFCMKGIRYNGHSFVDEAIKNGANVVVYSDEINLNSNVIYIKVNSVNDTLAKVSSIFYDYPASKLESYLVSGTNGRSSVTTIINSILSKYKKCGSVGVFGINNGENSLLSTHSNLTLLDNQKVLSDFVKDNCEVCTFEASAISLLYKKLSILKPKAFIYTYTCTDSKEYKETRIRYVEALKRYMYSLDENTLVVLNRDDSITFEELYKAASNNKISYGQNSDSDYLIKDIKLYKDHSTFILVYNGYQYPVYTKLLGLVNVYNVTSSLATLHAMGYNMNDLLLLLKDIECVDGIMDRLSFTDFNIYVDCASDFETLEASLDYAKQITHSNNRLFTLISINTTDTDSRLMKIMNIAKKYSDLIVLTEDDTYEDDIIEYMNKAASYIKNCSNIMIEDREEAIAEVIELMNKNDTLMILGKGNEKFLYKGLVKKDYNGDKNIAYKYMNKRLREEKEVYL